MKWTRAMGAKDAASKKAFSEFETIKQFILKILVKPGQTVEIVSIERADPTQTVLFNFLEGDSNEDEEENKQDEEENKQKEEKGKSGDKRKSHLITLERTRDLFFKVTVRQKNGKLFTFFLGFEIQSTEDNLMLPRINLYDKISYHLQLSDYLSSGQKGKPVLIPVYTILINLTGKAWKGPRDLMDLMDLENLGAMVPPKMSGYFEMDPNQVPSNMEFFPGSLGITLDLLARINDPLEFLDFGRVHMEEYRKIHPDHKQLLIAYTDLTEQLDKESGDIMTFAEKLKKQVEDQVREEDKKRFQKEKQEEKKENAIVMLKDKLSPKLVAKYSRLSIDEVLELQKTL